jgi:hypothetical protein
MNTELEGAWYGASEFASRPRKAFQHARGSKRDEYYSVIGSSFSLAIIQPSSG